MPVLKPARRAALALLCSLILAACAAPAPRSTPGPAATYPPMPTLTRVLPTVIPATREPVSAVSPAAAPTASEQAFASLAEALPALDFTPLIPAYIPDQLPLARVAVANQGELRLTYAFSSPSGEASPRALSLAQNSGGEQINEAYIRNPDHGALDAVSTRVRGETGFFFWMYAGGGRPSYRLAWREENVNLTLALTGSWSAASADPHSLDSLLGMIASGLTFDAGTWQTVTLPAQPGPVTLAVPPDWKPDGANAYSGPGGFARLEIDPGPRSDLTQVCEWEANAYQERYSAGPELSLIQTNSPEEAICLIRPEGGQAAILIPYPPGAQANWRVLRVSARHALAVARSLSLPARPAGTATPRVVVTPPPAQPASPQAITWQGLSVEIYPLGRLNAASPDVFLTAPPEALEKRRAIREQPAPAADQAVLNGQQITLKTASIQHPFAENGQAQISADGQVIFRYNLISPAEARAARLFAWKDQWVINLNGTLVISGEIANLQLGYDRIDGWTLLAGKPFYFAQKDGQARISYNGVLFPQVFDQILETYPRGSNERMVWFYALKDGQVFYIEMSR